MSIAETIATNAWTPLVVTEQGSVRIQGTRVGLECIVTEFQRGQSPEMIARAFDTVPLADVYAAISFYLRNRTLVDEYMAEYARLAEEGRKNNPAFVERILASRKPA